MHMTDDQTHLTEEDQFAAAKLPDESGKPEVPEQPQQQTSAEQEPFEGFSALPPAAQEHFRRTVEQSQKLEQDLALQRRQYGALAGRVPALQRQLDEQKKRTAAAPSSAPAQTAAEAWEAYKQQWPEEAKAIEQYHARQAAEVGGKLDPIAQELKDLREWREQVQEQMTEAENEEIIDFLTDSVPDWQTIAGWENGAPTDRGWHPEFSAWLESLPTRMRGSYEESLSSRAPEDIVFVLNAFKRDYLIALQEEESAAGQVPQQQSGRRQQAMRDVTPTGGSHGMQLRAPNGQFMSEEERYAATVDQYRSQFQGWAQHG